MGFQIQDGTGSSRKAKVNTRYRLITDSITEERAVYNSVVDGKTFVCFTDFITFTGSGTNEFGLLYVKNTSDDLMLIHHVKIWSGTLNQTAKIRMYDDPTTGTLISDGFSAEIMNINTGSSQEFEGLSYQPSDATKTITNGEVMGNHYIGSGNQQMLAMMWNGAMVLPKGKAMAITVQPDNAAQISLTAEVEVYFEKSEE